MRNCRATVLAIVLLAFAGVVSGANGQSCVSSGEGQQLVTQGQVVTLYVALQRAGLAEAQVLDASLCGGGGSWVYRVRYRLGEQVSQVSIPAN